MDESKLHHIRRAWRDVVQSLWGSREEVDRLSPEQARMVGILEDHPEYRRFWEDPELAVDTAGEGGVNPFLHVQIHAMVESQLANNHPREVRHALERLVAAEVSRHEAIHQIGEALVREMGPAATGGEAFDIERYSLRLRGLGG
jgi:hypothetical protein